jgi:hypothetical protein
MTTHRIGYFIGSLATGSINRVLSKALIKQAPKDLELTEIPINDLPLYSYDYDADYPPMARALKEAIEASDGILFISPEYSRSIPGAGCVPGRFRSNRCRVACSESGNVRWPVTKHRNMLSPRSMPG